MNQAMIQAISKDDSQPWRGCKTFTKISTYKIEVNTWTKDQV